MADPLIERALVLTHVKQPGISDFCHILNQYGVEIFSTGEIFKNLKEARVEVSPLFKFTGTPFPPDEALEILHPSIISGLSLNKDNISSWNAHMRKFIKPSSTLTILI